MEARQSTVHHFAAKTVRTSGKARGSLRYAEQRVRVSAARARSRDQLQWKVVRGRDGQSEYIPAEITLVPAYSKGKGDVLSLC